MKSRAFLAFVAVFCVGALVYGPLSSLLKVSPGFYWASVLLIALLAAGGAVAKGTVGLTGAGPFLCDSCRYNDSRYCDRPERPNATHCAEYRRR